MTGYFINDLHIDKWVKTQSSFSNTAQYKKLLEKWCLPADCLFIAGDVACSVNSIFSTFKVLSDMYQHIFYVYGNHEMRLNEEDCSRGLDTYTKRERIETFLHTATFDERKKVDMLDILKGVERFWNGKYICGGMGYADGSATSDSEHMLEKWQNGKDYQNFKLGWTTDFNEMAEYENEAVARSISKTTDILVTHFPAIQLIERDKALESKGLDYGLSSFDGSKILEKLPDGAIWHSGHLHDQFKREVTIDGKKILSISNSVGSPEKPPHHKLDKKEFLINF